MTQKEKVNQWLSPKPTESLGDIRCEEIADEFAIGFADWNHKEGRFIQRNLTTKELLEIYKKL